MQLTVRCVRLIAVSCRPKWASAHNYMIHNPVTQTNRKDKFASFRHRPDPVQNCTHAVYNAVHTALPSQPGITTKLNVSPITTIAKKNK